MGKKKKVEVLIEGGKATPGPPLGPALGPYGVRMDLVVSEINKKTKEYEGMKVPVIVVVDVETRDFEVKVGVPPTSALILRELNVEKGSGAPGQEKRGDISFETVLKIAKIKMKQSTAYKLKSVVKEILGTCKSMGVTVDGLDPKEVIRRINDGEYDDKLAGE
ncbi:MAG: 50S ribosomal protein L11 [Thermoproteota archaeon]|nr:MAG: 50S ribosomal protein L11 [Candidatus Korarchaeota archaeon]HDN02014.1 50S ribosomal protein L11 [Candidatus Bathyarchaeota archaeon]